MTPAILHRRFDEVRVVVRGSVSPSEAEFDAHVAEALEMANAVRVVLVVTEDDARISPRQRARLIRSGLLTPPHAILTNSSLARVEMGATTALGANLRMFATAEFERACDFLGIERRLRPTIVAQIARMRQEIAAASVNAGLTTRAG